MVVFPLMVLIAQGPNATAEVEYVVESPVMHASPKKSPSPRMPKTAQRPRLETSVSFTTTFSMW
jgi:hypothetical protein